MYKHYVLPFTVSCSPQLVGSTSRPVSHPLCFDIHSKPFANNSFSLILIQIARGCGYALVVSRSLILSFQNPRNSSPFVSVASEHFLAPSVLCEGSQTPFASVNSRSALFSSVSEHLLAPSVLCEGSQTPFASVNSRSALFSSVSEHLLAPSVLCEGSQTSFASVNSR